jgi:hypothetical protein
LYRGGAWRRREGEEDLGCGAYILKTRKLMVRLESEKGINAFDALARKLAELLEGMEVEATAER